MQKAEYLDEAALATQGDQTTATMLPVRTTIKENIQESGFQKSERRGDTQVQVKIQTTTAFECQ